MYNFVHSRWELRVRMKNNQKKKKHNKINVIGLRFWKWKASCKHVRKNELFCYSTKIERGCREKKRRFSNSTKRKHIKVPHSLQYRFIFAGRARQLTNPPEKWAFFVEINSFLSLALSSHYTLVHERSNFEIICIDFVSQEVKLRASLRSTTPRFPLTLSEFFSFSSSLRLYLSIIQLFTKALNSQGKRRFLLSSSMSDERNKNP